MIQSLQPIKYVFSLMKEKSSFKCSIYVGVKQNSKSSPLSRIRVIKQMK